ncbi:hypothetical protein B9T31_09485 [Acinetobacter sp. ANC 4558]|uniref:hypothetical protein n=1 Tax=Acinetobacter sp. ANC 4558 TaxID=1977876 RepID=UPI000A355B68|nr:hypothetical protein [Acinetobacter sp. ANC 4558]OTG85818.1 hypothetical protein B9T31_09485 [Acinetobacter sp. ANC 4558]
MSQYQYLTMACKDATDQDEEVDFILNGESLVIVAVEVCLQNGIKDAHEKLINAFPNHKVMTTYAPLFNYFQSVLELQTLEAELSIGDSAMGDHRLDKAFHWKELKAQKH